MRHMAQPHILQYEIFYILCKTVLDNVLHILEEKVLI